MLGAPLDPDPEPQPLIRATSSADAMPICNALDGRGRYRSLDARMTCAMTRALPEGLEHECRGEGRRFKTLSTRFDEDVDLKSESKR